MARECTRSAGSRPLIGLAEEGCACARMRVGRKHPKPRGKLRASGVLPRVVTEFRLLEFGRPNTY